ncbi:MAG: ribokinase [Candidatus Roseilinea sp.]|uniref:ribokinase n=1 Tax=Candidatus Roseilinea sp. TaxID=2838777 RepID=UPI00404B79AF
MAQSPQTPQIRRPITILGGLKVDLFMRAPRWPASGRVTLAQSALIDGGGKGANQALMVARMGWPAALIGCVGADIAGASLLAYLRTSGVDVSRVRQDDNTCTGVFILMSAPDEQHGIVVVNGANDQLSVEDVGQHADTLRNSAALIAQLEVPGASVEAALQTALRAGVLTVFNVSPCFDFPRSALTHCDYAIVNEDEAQWLTGAEAGDITGAAEAARRIEAMGARNVLVTMGARGVWLHTRDCQEHVPAWTGISEDVEAAVGAGDAFVGAFTIRLCEGADAREAVRFASAAAALSVTRTGAQAALPTRDAVESLLRSGSTLSNAGRTA